MSDELLNLVPAIRSIEHQIDCINIEYRQKLIAYETSLKQLRELNQVCEICAGEKKILRKRSCAEDDRPDPNDPNDYDICPGCHGTGRKS